MTSCVPAHLPLFLGLSMKNDDRAKKCPCPQPFCERLGSVQLQPCFKCFGFTAFPASHTSHLKDWILANSTSRRFRQWAKAAFFSEKTFIIAPSILHQLRNGTIETLSQENLELLFQHTKRIIAPIPRSSAASTFLTLPHYQRFKRVRSLAIWPGRPARSDTCDFELKQKPAPEEMVALFKGIGLDSENVDIEVVYSVDGIQEQWTLDHVESEIYPCLRWVGRQRASAVKRKAEEQSHRPTEVPGGEIHREVD